MTDLYRLRVTWSGLAGSPGYTTFYSLAIPPVAAVSTFFDALKTFHPSGQSWAIPNFGDVIDSTDGSLKSSWSGGSSSTVTSATAGTYAAPAGYMVQFPTTTIVDHHRLKGRIYMVPCLTALYEANGTIANGLIGSINTAAAALVSAYSAQLVVWHRPKVVGGSVVRSGSHGIVTGSSCPDKVVVLRSRRD